MSNRLITATGLNVRTAESIRLRQGAMVSEFIQNVVYPYSPHYRRLFDEHNISPSSIQSIEDLQKLPFTSKEDLVKSISTPESARDFVIQPNPAELARKPSTLLKALVMGKQRVKKQLDREFRPIFMTSTTGRSADPIPFLYTWKDINNLITAGKQLMDVVGATNEDRVLNMFPYAPHLAYWLAHYATQARNVFCLGSGGGKVMGTEGNLRMMKKIKPTVLVGMPTFIYHVLQEAIEENCEITSIKKIILGGEKVIGGTRRRLSAICKELGSRGVQVVATYGFTEAKMAWVEAPIVNGNESSGYLTTPKLGIVEVIDPKTGEVLPEGVGGEIVFTPLESRGTVVLRYRTGDFIEGGLVTNVCQHTGRMIPRLIGKISRTSEFKSLKLKKVKGTIVDFNEMEYSLDNMETIGTWQIELRKKNDDALEMDELWLHIVKRKNVTEARIVDEITNRFQRRFELRPNEICFHTIDEMRKRQKVGSELKEIKILDSRPTSVEPQNVVK